MIGKDEWVDIFYKEMCADVVEVWGKDVNEDNEEEIRDLLGRIFVLIIKV